MNDDAAQSVRLAWFSHCIALIRHSRVRTYRRSSGGLWRALNRASCTNRSERVSIVYNMESDTATVDWSSTRKDSLETSMPRKFRKESCRTGGETLNWAMCALCIASFAVSGLMMYREIGLESRIATLEARIQLQETPDVLIQRLRREVQQQMEVHRASKDSNVFRSKRETSDCNCPPGKLSPLTVSFQTPYLMILLVSRSRRANYAVWKSWRKWRKLVIRINSRGRGTNMGYTFYF